MHRFKKEFVSFRIWSLPNPLPLLNLLCFFFRMSPMQAMDWLLQNESDPSIDDPLTPDQLMSYLPERKRKERRTGKREFVPNPKVIYLNCLTFNLTFYFMVFMYSNLCKVIYTPNKYPRRTQMLRHAKGKFRNKKQS